MELQIEHRLGHVRVIVQGPEDSREMKQIVSLLQTAANKLWAMDEEKNMVSLSIDEIVWAETVEDKLFVYTAQSMFQAPLQSDGTGAAVGTCRPVSMRKIHPYQSERRAAAAQLTRRTHRSSTADGRKNDHFPPVYARAQRKTTRRVIG